MSKSMSTFGCNPPQKCIRAKDNVSHSCNGLYSSLRTFPERIGLYRTMKKLLQGNGSSAVNAHVRTFTVWQTPGNLSRGSFSQLSP